MTIQLVRRLTIGLTLVSSGFTTPVREAPRPGYGPVTPRTAYVVAVGIDHYPSLSLVAGVSDARKFARRIRREWCDSDCKRARAQPSPKSTSVDASFFNPDLVDVSVTLVLDSAATLAGIDRAVGDVVKRARKDDIVIFFFAGRSVYDSDSAGKTTVYLCTIDAFCPTGSVAAGERRRTGEGGITGSRLRRWLEGTSAERQLVVLDACSHPDYASELVSSVAPNDPTVAGLTTRNRVVLSSLTLAQETKELGGALTNIITGTNDLLTDAPFQAPSGARHLFERDLRVREAEVSARFAFPVELGIFFERDFLRLLAATQPDDAGASRGAGSAVRPAAADTTTGASYALVIGTDTYAPGTEWKRLSNPVSDARAVAAELRDRYGYTVNLLENPKLTDVHHALRDLQKRTFGPKDEVFIFVAGHGYYDESMDQGFLVPHDARALADDEGRTSYLGFAQIEGYVNKIPAQHVLIALDACFGGTFAQRLSQGDARGDGDTPAYKDASRDQLIQEALKYRSRLYLASGGKEYVPDGRPGRHSPFASRLLEALRSGGGDRGVLTMLDLRASLEKLAPPVPQPRGGSFGDNEPGGNYVFVARTASR